MKLKEFEAKQLLREVGITTSKGYLIRSMGEVPYFTQPHLVKVQTMAGKRGKAGGIIEVKTPEEAKKMISQFLGTVFLDETIKEILLDEKIAIEKELYLGLKFDTAKKCPVLIYSEQGGMEIEDAEKIVVQEINYLEGINKEKLGMIPTYLQEVIEKLYACFLRYDCKMIEINPLVVTPKQELIAVDGVVVLDELANFRREVVFPERTGKREATAREIAARKIDEEDYRGVAGKTFLDLDGDIGILTSGGGASMTLMDALIRCKGNPANFTEYSGNPPLEKVEKLTRIVLDKPHLAGLLIAGVIANFTDIAETLQGIGNVLREKKPDFPIVIRRAGPNDEKAKQNMERIKQELGLNIHYFDEKVPLTKAVEIMVELANEFKRKMNDVGELK